MGSELRKQWATVGGNAPDHWGYATIESLLFTPKSIAVGVMYPGSNTEGGVPLVKVSDVKNGRVISKPDFLISPAKDQEYKRTRLAGNELLITLVGNPGDCVYVTPGMAGWNVARAIAVLRLKNPELREWVRHVLLSPPAQHFIDSRLNTTVQKTLNLKDIRELVIPIPPENERRRITCVVGTLDDKIELNRQMNTTLEAMAQALFKSWFVDFDPVIDNALAVGNPIPDELAERAERRAKAAQQPLPEHPHTLPAAIRQQFPDRFVFTETMGWVPEGWFEGTLEDMLVLQRGFDLPKTNRTDGDYPLMAASGQDGTHSEFKVKGPGITTGRSGKLGDVNFVHRDFWPLNTTLWIKEYKNSSPYHALYLLRSLGLETYNSGSAVPTLNRNYVHNIPLGVPPESIVNAYSEAVQPFYEKMDGLTRQQAWLTLVRDTLLPKLLSGQLRIPEAEQLLAEVI